MKCNALRSIDMWPFTESCAKRSRRCLKTRSSNMQEPGGKAVLFASRYLLRGIALTGC